ncbi:hypothetical protein M432DRAFT_298693 [Thermoascus aurantiacus ATCC 26904]
MALMALTARKSALWYCCNCNYGPHDPAIHAACINCGVRRCDFCPSEGTKNHASHDCDPVSPYPSVPSTLPPIPETYEATVSRSGHELASATDYLSVSNVLNWSHPTRLSTSARTYGHTYMYICCVCGDGPKVFNVQPKCVMCNHTACSNCEQVKK